MNDKRLRQQQALVTIKDLLNEIAPHTKCDYKNDLLNHISRRCFSGVIDILMNYVIEKDFKKKSEEKLDK